VHPSRQALPPTVPLAWSLPHAYKTTRPDGGDVVQYLRTGTASLALSATALSGCRTWPDLLRALRAADLVPPPSALPSAPPASQRFPRRSAGRRFCRI